MRTRTTGRTIPGIKYSAGIGYLIIPKDIDRDTYILNAFRTGRVLMLTDNGEQSENVKVSKSAMNDLEFPTEVDGLGSLVVWVLHPLKKIPIIAGVINGGDETSSLAEGGFNFTKTLNDCLVSIQGNAKNKSISINLEGEGGVISILSLGKGGTLRLSSDNIKTQSLEKYELDGKNTKVFSESSEQIKTSEGDILLEIIKNKDLVTITKGKTKLDIRDNYILIEKEEGSIKVSENIEIISKEGILFKSASGTLLSAIDDLLDEISKITTVTALGTQPILNAIQFQTLKTKFSKILK